MRRTLRLLSMAIPLVMIVVPAVAQLDLAEGGGLEDNYDVGEPPVGKDHLCDDEDKEDSCGVRCGGCSGVPLGLENGSELFFSQGSGRRTPCVGLPRRLGCCLLCSSHLSALSHDRNLNREVSLTKRKKKKFRQLGSGLERT